MKSFTAFILEAYGIAMDKAEAMDILGLKKAYTADELKKSWKRAAMNAHPDRGGSNEKMLKVNAAYDLLLSNKDAIASKEQPQRSTSKQTGTFITPNVVKRKIPEWGIVDDGNMFYIRIGANGKLWLGFVYSPFGWTCLGVYNILLSERKIKADIDIPDTKESLQAFIAANKETDEDYALRIIRDASYDTTKPLPFNIKTVLTNIKQSVPDIIGSTVNCGLVYIPILNGKYHILILASMAGIEIDSICKGTNYKRSIVVDGGFYMPATEKTVAAIVEASKISVNTGDAMRILEKSMK